MELEGNANKKLKHKMTLFDCPYYCHPKHVWIIKKIKSPLDRISF